MIKPWHNGGIKDNSGLMLNISPVGGRVISLRGQYGTIYKTQRNEAYSACSQRYM